MASELNLKIRPLDDRVVVEPLEAPRLQLRSAAEAGAADGTAGTAGTPPGAGRQRHHRMRHERPPATRPPNDRPGLTPGTGIVTVTISVFQGGGERWRRGAGGARPGPRPRQGGP